jgi:osmoprotectant transport system permease protein
MAVPLIMAGVRTSGVQVVATTSLIALTGGGALGRYIIDGLATRDFVEVFVGALLVAILSIVAELLLGLLQRALVPKGLTAGDASGINEIDLSVRPGAAVLAGEQVAL